MRAWMLAVVAVAAAVVARADEPVFVDLQGRTVHASDHRGEIVVLNFWATYCGPCRKEMPSLVRISDAYKAKGVRVIGAAADGRDQAPAVTQAMTAMDVRFDVWLWVSAKDMAYYGVGPGLPGTVILDRSGTIRRSVRGPVDEKDLRALLDSLLAEAPQQAAAKPTR